MLYFSATPPTESSSRSELPAAMLRMVVGWHFLYEGLTKLMFPGWTSAGYLKGSSGPLAGIFQWLGSQSTILPAVDRINIWSLTLIGLALMLGVGVRVAAGSGMALLALYYLAYPPFFSPAGTPGAEGAYLIVNKNLVELFALSAIASFPALKFGLGGLIDAWSKHAAKVETATAADLSRDRRRMVANLAGVPVLGAFVLAVLRKHGWKSFEESNLRTQGGKKGDTVTASATLRNYTFTARADLRGQLPYANIGKMNLSRMILGGNLIGGWAHARDLLYVSKLVKAYHHREKVFQTLALAESCGINTLLTNPQLSGVITDYWRNGGRIQFISDCGGKNLIELVQKSIDTGASSCYIQGALSDELVAAGKFDLMAEALELIRRNGLPAGIGAHKLRTVLQCAEKGLQPDYWMKTLHESTYWSARPGDKECDNNWCDDPQGTIDFMTQQKQPWIAFKVLAAGALQPKPGFRYAFESGADFICVGMYDFQIVDDVNIALDVLKGPLTRQRVWCA